MLANGEARGAAWTLHGWPADAPGAAVSLGIAHAPLAGFRLADGRFRASEQKSCVTQTTVARESSQTVLTRERVRPRPAARACKPSLLRPVCHEHV